jgi:hypothetical protein
MGYPSEWETVFTLKNGKKVNFRPEQFGDTEMLWKMFSTLSDKSVSNMVAPFTGERIDRAHSKGKWISEREVPRRSRSAESPVGERSIHSHS